MQDWMISTFFVLYMIALVMMIIGLWTRPAIFVVWLGLNSIHNRNLINNNTGYDAMMLCMTIYLFFAQSGAAVSVDRLIRVLRGDQSPPYWLRAAVKLSGEHSGKGAAKREIDRLWRLIRTPRHLDKNITHSVATVDEPLVRFGRIFVGPGQNEEPPRMSIWPVRLMQLQVTIVYLSTFLNKETGPLWMRGTAVYYPYHVQEFHKFTIPLMDGDHMWFINAFTYGTLVIELLLGSLIWVPRLRPYILLLGVALHMGIEYSINIPLFGYVMISSYLAFLTQNELMTFVAWFKKTMRMKPLTVVYDGKCDFCRSAVLAINTMDTFHLIRFFDYNQPEELKQTPVLFEDAEQAVAAVDFRGRITTGYQAFRQIAKRLPALWVLTPVFAVVGWTPLGNMAYRWVAANRYRLPVAPAIADQDGSRNKASKRPSVVKR